MLTLAPDHAARRAAALERARERGAAALLISDLVNVFYCSGFSGSNASLLLTDGRDVLVTDSRYTEQAARECPDLEVAVHRDTVAAAVQAAVDAGALPLGLEAEDLSWASHARLAERFGADRLVSTTGLVEQGRRRKDDYEVACLERACAIVDGAWAKLIDVIAVGRTERELAVVLDRAMIDLGAEDVGFPTIVAAGPNSAVPHHAPTDRPLARGDLLKVDAGARCRGYHSDMTRTVVVGAPPTDEQRELHGAVAAAAAAARGVVAAGTAMRVADAAARKGLGGYAARFIHGLGHGVGLQIHEAPQVNGQNADTMEASDVLTIEPGAYLPGFGGVRIEDTLLVTDTGSRCLTTAPRDLFVVG